MEEIGHSKRQGDGELVFRKLEGRSGGQERKSVRERGEEPVVAVVASVVEQVVGILVDGRLD